MPSPALLVELGAVLLGLGALGRLAGRFGLSPLPLYLVAGLALGTLGSGGLLPVRPAGEFVDAGAGFAAVLLLFGLGLRYSPAELAAGARGSVTIGVADALLNFTPGAAAGILLGWDTGAALLLGGVTWVSSPGVAAGVLCRFGRVGNRETPAVLSVLAVEAVAMAGFLPVAAVVSRGGGALPLVSSLLVAAAVVAAAGWVATRPGARLSRLVFSPPDDPPFPALGLALAMAGVAAALSVSAPAGAFLAGIVVSGAASAARPVLDSLRDLSAGAFFVLFGLSLGLSDVPGALGVAVLLAAATLSAKAATGWWAAARLGVSRPGRARAGATLVARGEFSLVIAGLGTALEPGLAPLAAAYVAVTGVAGPLLARHADGLVAWFTRAKGTGPGRAQ